MARGIEDMSMYKMTLRPWLWKKIEDGEYMGLEWVDRRQLQFKLPWVKENDPNAHEFYKLFHDWDQRDGNNIAKKPDQIVKRNFRSVLNKSPHFKKLSLVEQQTGSYKVYQFLMPDEKKGARGMRGSSTNASAESGVSLKKSRQSNGQDRGSESSEMTAEIDLTEERDDDICMHVAANELADSACMVGVDNAADFFPGNSSHQDMEMDVMMDSLAGQDIAENLESMETISSSHASDVNADLMKSKLLEAGIKSIDLPTCTMTVSYSGHEVLSKKLTDMRHGYKVSFASEEMTTEFKLLSGVPTDRSNIPLPKRDTGANFQKILFGVGPGGVDFWFDDKEKCIMMTRLCQSHVFYVSAQSERPEESRKVNRDETVELFSYKKFFYSLFTSQVDGGPQNHEIYFVIGTKPKKTKEEGTEGVRITLRPDALKEILLQASDSLKEICVSEPQPIDWLLYAAHIKEMGFEA